MHTAWKWILAVNSKEEMGKCKEKIVTNVFV
jgi:hypothetical protein